MIAGEREVSITRVKKLRARNFRGLVGVHEFDLDADLVLVEGPNGHGKSSLLEALLWLATGHSYHFGDPNYNFASLQTDGVCMLEGRCDCAVQDGRKRQIENATFSGKFKTTNEIFPACADKQLKVSTQLEGKNSPISPELAAQLCSFYQEDFKAVFDAMARGKTMQRALEELPPSVQGSEEELQKLIEEGFPKLRATYSSIESYKSNIEVFLQCCNSFTATYGELRKEHFRDWPAWRETTGLEEWERQVKDFLSRFLEPSNLPGMDLPWRFFSILGDKVERLSREYSRTGTILPEEAVELEVEAKEYDTEIEEINKKYPNLDEDLERYRHPCLGASSKEDGEHADTAEMLFNILRDKAASWGQETSAELALVSREFGRVDPELAGQCAKELGDWLAKRRRAMARKNALGLKKNGIKDKLEKLRSHERARQLNELWESHQSTINELRASWEKELEYRGAQQLKPAKDYIEQQIRILERFLVSYTKATEPNPDITERVGRNVTNVLHRFSMVEGILPLVLESCPDEDGKLFGCMPRTQDGRHLSELSTGQKAQLAVALMAAQNLSLPPGLPKVLILDDVSTSYDLSNLTREALLWRQLAYGDEEEYRRQLFISSHHEDLTQGLLDLLTPPAGKKMRLIRFKSWNAETGPVVEHFEVEPTGAAWNMTESSDDATPAKKEESHQATEALKTFAEALCKLSN